MKNAFMLLLALIAVLIVWGLVRALIFFALHIVIKIAVIAFFCWLVYAVFKMLTRESQKI
jgi:hypothetical protein